MYSEIINIFEVAAIIFLVYNYHKGTCPRCSGNGGYSCSGCKGSGIDFNENTCSVCNGSGWLGCDLCGGTGES